MDEGGCGKGMRGKKISDDNDAFNSKFKPSFPPSRFF